MNKSIIQSYYLASYGSLLGYFGPYILAWGGAHEDSLVIGNQSLMFSLKVLVVLVQFISYGLGVYILGKTSYKESRFYYVLIPSLVNFLGPYILYFVIPR